MLEPGHDVLIDDGLIRLRVESVGSGRVRCRVVVGGEVKANKGVNLPGGVAIPIPSLTEKDVKDLEFALGLDVDYVALSFVRSADDIAALKELIASHGSEAHVIAKIEKAEAVDALDDILAEADSVMVARGDLGVEIGPEMVPMLQKQIIARSLEAGKPVITATQMLESMVEHAEPTRAEASDVANAILDGTSAVMMSAETAAGAYPVEAVRDDEQHREGRRADDELPARGAGRVPDPRCPPRDVERRHRPRRGTRRPRDAGRDRERPHRVRDRPPEAAPPARRPLPPPDRGSADGARWGVLPLLMPSTADVEELWARAIETARNAGIIDHGDLVVLIAGTAVNLTGSTNVIKVDTA